MGRRPGSLPRTCAVSPSLPVNVRHYLPMPSTPADRVRFMWIRAYFFRGVLLTIIKIAGRGTRPASSTLQVQPPIPDRTIGQGHRRIDNQAKSVKRAIANTPRHAKTPCPMREMAHIALRTCRATSVYVPLSGLPRCPLSAKTRERSAWRVLTIITIRRHPPDADQIAYQ